MAPVNITLDNWYILVDKAQEIAGCDLTVWECCCGYYNLCAESVITPESVYLWNLYNRLKGTEGCSFNEYWELPALYISVCEVIESEQFKVQKSKAREK